MAQYRSLGGLFTLEPGQTVTWTTAIGGGLDGGVVVQAPNIIDDVIGSDVLVTVNQGVIATNNGLNYTITITNPGSRPVPHNLNVQDWF
ncbi:hypothetical protein EVC45_25760 [Paraburkholderia sp. UYCP14C]|uniref:hypothetical protein n=1 Tax=Paraburkholderia sp. UYCP14C TaxID=2511130 RepID=UPI0010207E8F|nr:hypothetical protein [Paraburkholderia sp. UYCP14C]RZF26901.1 hypothetical protein EVC45_25760 [Paraburkholderia sp. UYCP14C]